MHMNLRRGFLTIFFGMVILMSFIFVITSSNQSNYFKSDFISQLTDADSVDDVLLLMMGTEIPALKAYLEDNNIKSPNLSPMLFKMTSGITPKNFPSLLEAELPGLKSYALGINSFDKENNLDTKSNQSPPPDFEDLVKEDDEKSDEEKKDADDEAKNKDEEKQNEQEKQNSEKTLADYHFVLDPGHGGKDTGTIGTAVYEKTLTLSTAKKVEQQLRDKGASVTLTRTDDTFIPLEERAQISNSTETDAFISLHYNASDDPSVNGIHSFYYDGDENEQLANTIQESLINRVNLMDHGAEQADYQVLRDNKQTALLLELGFVSNPEEQKVIQTDSYQEKAAEGIVDGLENYFQS